MAEKLNTHFAMVASRTIDSGNFNEDINNFLRPYHATSFEFKEISAKDIAEAIDSLSSSKARSHDGITAFMVKSAKVEMLPILTYLFNRSIALKCFPKLWKDAIVTPLYKSDSADDESN